MKLKLDMIAIWTNDIKAMKKFYHHVLGFEVNQELESYVEFKNENIRLTICERHVMNSYSEAFKEKVSGQQFELAFCCDNVDETYEMLLKKGAKGIHPPADMPWGQRTALFSDPDGNIHEIFMDL